MRFITRPQVRGTSACWRGTLALLGLIGCGSIEPVAPHEQPLTDPAQLYMGLTFDHPAVNLSTAAGYNTVLLTATPRDALGDPMPGLPAPTYFSSDTTKIRVTADGLVTALETGNGLKVTATLTDGLVTRTDETWINVTSLQAPPVLDTLSVQPLPPDSAVWSVWKAEGIGYGATLRLGSDR